MNLSKKTQQAIARYGESSCLRAFEFHTTFGYGAAGIAHGCNIPSVLTTQQADAAINAGREINAAREAQLYDRFADKVAADPHSCKYGHIGCSHRAGGPCLDELFSSLTAEAAALVQQ